MAKLGCICGLSIVDQSDNLPYKGEIIRDQERFTFYDGLKHALSSFIEALLQGKREEWLREHMPEEYPHIGDSNEEAIETIFLYHLPPRTLEIYQCLNCGTLWIQTDPYANTFRSFAATAWKEGEPSILQG